jgi:hypothetical protein
MTENVREALIDGLNGAAEIDDPFTGAASPEIVAKRSRLWPGPHWSDIAHLATTASGGRRIDEYVFTPADGGTPLPVVVVREGDRARLYAAHELVADRAPMLPLDAGVRTSAEPGDFLDGYFAHLTAGDLEGSVAMFEPDGYIQHSNGERFQGPDRLREDYVKMFAHNKGRIEVKFANVTDDGQRRAFECVMPSGRPAIAIYERGANGKIAAVRISL